MKEEFIEMVKTKNYPLEWFYKLFVQRTRTDIGVQMFIAILQKHDFNKIVDNTAKSFGLTRVVDSNNTVLTVF